jgi:hypothetical protein
MKYFYIFLVAVFVFLERPAFSQNDSLNTRPVIADTLNEKSGLFDSNELLLVSLKFDITQYKRKRSDVDYLDAILTYYTGKNDSTTKAIKVRSRGKFRHDFCEFPPLLLNFKMGDTLKGEFFKINKLKMVTQCKPGNEEILLKEYLVYKLYNVFTDISFRVRLLKVKYINTAKNKKPVSEYAFVIEPVDLLARRLNSVEVKTTLTQKNIRPEMMNRMAVFNYMIGNTDWSVPINHNVVILSQGISFRPDMNMIVPFDFDYSGFVNASYAVPFEGLQIKSVLDRQYLGMCRTEKEFLNALNEFSDKKEELYKVVAEFPYLKEKTKKELISYLDEFFQGFNKRNTLVNKLRSECLRF